MSVQPLDETRRGQCVAATGSFLCYNALQQDRPADCVAYSPRSGRALLPVANDVTESPHQHAEGWTRGS
jgi:hypothetical protein